MANFNRFSLLQVDQDDHESKGAQSANMKSKNFAKGKTNTANKVTSDTCATTVTKKRSRKKKNTPGNLPNAEEQEKEEEERRVTLNDISFEEAMKEAILNSQITYEEEQVVRKEQPAVTEEEIPVLQKRKSKKSGKKGRQGIPVSFEVLRTAEISNGKIKMQAPKPPSPPALPQRNGGMEAILADNEKEAHRLLEAEKRKEIRQRNFLNFAIPIDDDLSAGNSGDVEETLDIDTLKRLLVERDHEITHLNDMIKSLKLERDELKRYFQICENKTLAQLGAEVDKLSRLNRELNNNLVDTCIKLEQERSRAGELEKTLTASGRTHKTSHRTSESEW